MKSRIAATVVGLVLLSLGSLSCGIYSAASDDEVAVIETSYGRIVIEFFPQEAPKHVTNFKELVSENFYDGTKIHRLIKTKSRPVAIQGGDPNTINGDPSTWGKGQPGQKTVPAEISSKINHVRGVVSAARRPDDKDSATSQFFICVAPQPTWDGEYTIFGHVIEGISVVDTIARAPVWKDSDRPMDPVVVSRVYLVKRDELK